MRSYGLFYEPNSGWFQVSDSLYDRTTNDKYDDTTRFKLTYQLLKGISGKPYYKACYKHYLSANVRSQFAKVDSADWEIAIFLPIESFNSFLKSAKTLSLSFGEIMHKKKLI